MKRTAILLITALFFVAFSADAQHPMTKKKEQSTQMMSDNKGMMQMHMKQKKQKCPMCGKMMQQQMPMQKYMMLVNHLPGMHSKLSLSEEQTENLIDLRAEYKKRQIDLKAKLSKNKMKMKKLLDANASAKDIENQMMACSKLKVAMKVSAYKTASEMKLVLSDEQKEKLHSMKNHH